MWFRLNSKKTVKIKQVRINRQIQWSVEKDWWNFKPNWKTQTVVESICWKCFILKISTIAGFRISKN